MGDVGTAEDLEGERFNLADSQNLIYIIIVDNELEPSIKTDYFAFRGPRQRKEGEGEPNIPRNMDFLLPQTFLGSIYHFNSFHFVDFDHISLFSLFELASSCISAFYYRLFCFISLFIRILIPTRVPKIVGIHPLDDPDNRFLVSDFLTCAAPRTVAFAPEQLRFLSEPIILALTPITYDTAIPNIPTYIISLDLNAVPAPVVHI